LSFLGFEVSTALVEVSQNFLVRVTKLSAFSPFSGVLPNVKHSSCNTVLRWVGHEAEALARPILEGRIGENLFPVVGTEGDLMASLDG